MKEQADTLMLLNTEKLIKAVLQNCERVYKSQFDSSIQVSDLDQAMLNRNLSGGIERAPNYRPVWLAEYFGQNLEKLSERVPFVGLDRRDDQLFFLNQIRQMIRNLTYNYRHLELLLPEEKSTESDGKKNTDYLYTDSQNLHIYLGLVRPSLAAMEQREIQKISSAESGQVPTAQSNVQNPYQNSGQNILVKGTNGEFDQVLSYQEIQEISEQIKTLRGQGQSPAQINAFIKQSFNGLNIFVNENGQLEIFMASNLHPGEKVRNLFSVDELNRLFDIRLGHEIRGKILQYGNGNISFNPESFGLETSAAETANFKGGEVYLDESGDGNNIFFFLTDDQNSTALVSASASDLRSGPNANTNFQISPDQRKIPFGTSPVRISADQYQVILPQKTLMQILIAAKEKGEFRPLSETKLTQPASYGEKPAIPQLPSRAPQTPVPFPQPQLPENIKVNLPQPVRTRTQSVEENIQQPQSLQTKGELNIPQPVSQPLPASFEQQNEEETNEEQDTETTQQRKTKRSHLPTIATITSLLASGGAVGGSFFLNWLITK